MFLENPIRLNTEKPDRSALAGTVFLFDFGMRIYGKLKSMHGVASLDDVCLIEAPRILQGIARKGCVR